VHNITLKDVMVKLPHKADADTDAFIVRQINELHWDDIKPGLTEVLTRIPAICDAAA